MKRCLPVVLMLYAFAATAQRNTNPVQRTQALELTFTASASPYLSPPYVSGVINDPTDPAAQIGISVTVKENSVAIPATDYTLTGSSSKTSVVPNANINITKSNGSALIKIVPTGVGYANITLTLTKASSNKTLVINYAASAAAVVPANTRWHSGFGDGSAAIALDDNYMVVADDESNLLYVHHRQQSGLYVKSYDYNNLLSLTDGSSGNYKEVDVEAAVKSIANANRYYWIGSMSNSSSFNDKPNRNRLFAMNITGTGAATSFSYVGKVSTLRSQLITWGNNNGYNFTASAADGKDPKTIDGFNIEGMCFGPDNTTLYIAFRAPLVPVSARTKAVIAPIQNFETWFNNGSPSGNATIGAPIELNLGGRGFRDIIRLSTGKYIISAGSYNGTANGALYKWTGNAVDPPILLNDFNIVNLNVEAMLEVVESGMPSTNKIQLLSDDGSLELYNDGTETKDLSQDNFKKYRSDVLTGSASVLPVTLQYFSVEKKNDYSQLSWRITQPERNASFEVQRSFNGRDFTAVKTIHANDETGFSFRDNFNTSSVWYRLSMLQDGNRTYSSAQFVDWNTVKNISLYPNPVVNDELNINTNKSSQWKLVVFDQAGKTVFQSSFAGQAYRLAAKGWPKGSYVLLLVSDETTVSKTFMIK